MNEQFYPRVRRTITYTTLALPSYKPNNCIIGISNIYMKQTVNYNGKQTIILIMFLLKLRYTFTYTH